MSDRASVLQSSIQRTYERLNAFEQRYNVDTAYFLQNMAAEDLVGGDLEYADEITLSRALEGRQDL